MEKIGRCVSSRDIMKKMNAIARIPEVSKTMEARCATFGAPR